MKRMNLDSLKELNGFNKLPKLQLKFELSNIKKKPLDTIEKQVKVLRKLFDNDTFDIREEFIILLFGSEFIPIGYFSLAKGDKNSVKADFHYLVQMLMLSGANAFIIAHNHPMGARFPSDMDYDFTHAVKGVTRFFDFQLLDHIILNRKKHFSFDEQGLIWDD